MNLHARSTIALALAGLAGCLTEAPADGSDVVAVVDHVAPAGEAATRCVGLALDNVDPIAARAITASFDGADRVLVYRGDDTTVGLATDAPCPGPRAPLMIAIASGQSLALPDGVGFLLAPHQPLLVELHHAGAAHAELRFAIAPGPVVAAGTLVVEATDFELPPGGAHRADAYFVPPPAIAGASFVSFTGSTRRHGIGMNVAMVADRLADKVPVYLPTPFHWDAPVTAVLAPARHLPAGGAFYFQCQYYNSTARTVRAGDGADDETCGFVATYYPATADLRCRGDACE